MRRAPLPYAVVAGALVLALGASLPVPAAAGTAVDSSVRSATDAWAGEAKTPAAPRAEHPEDRYAMAGGCYAIKASGGGYVERSGDGFAATAASAAGAEPFHFQATDLGSYLLFGSAGYFVAASEGALGEAAYAVTDSTPGATAGGLVLEQTDAAADAVARSDANRAAGRGAAVVAAARPGELADWTIAGDPGAFRITLPATEGALTTGDAGELVLGDTPAAFAFERRPGCAQFPEIEVDVEGPVLGGQTPYQEVRGHLEAHLHMMAFEFIGGRSRCGRPWHRFGVEHALVDCPDHEPGGHGAVLEAALSGGNPVEGHDTDGWPTFEGWPKPHSLTHEQVYYRWLERAWRGGLRLLVNLLVDNGALCELYPYRRNSCDEMESVKLQARRIRELERYVDAQSGGPGEGWFRIVDDPFEARAVINDGRLAVVLGMEVSVPLGCGIVRDVPTCPAGEIDDRLGEVYDLGVRQMELVNKFDNAFTGVTGDSGIQGPIVNVGNFYETGSFWRMGTCSDDDGHSHDHGEAHDHTQPNFHDESGAPDELSGRDSIFAAVLALFGQTGAAPLYPGGPHCNSLGLSDMGETAIREMVERGMIFDPDHMSSLARTQALELVEQIGRELRAAGSTVTPGVVSSHSWADDTVYEKIYELGGVVTPHAGGSASFVEKWERYRGWADDRFLFGIGYGSDANGFSNQGQPRRNNAATPVEYPFEGFGGTTVHKQVSGTRAPYDVNRDGVAHYGLYPDWIEDLRVQAGRAIVDDMLLGPEAYLQMWERAVGVRGSACRSDVSDLTPADFARLRAGMTAEEVLRTLGQPRSRLGTTFEYCMAGDATGSVRFSPGGEVVGWDDGTIVAPRETTLTLDDAVASRSEAAIARAVLTTDAGPLPGKTISFYVSDKVNGRKTLTLFATATTDAGGAATAEVPPRYVSPFPRGLQAVFEGDEELLGATAAASVYRV
ncbi:MAG: peptidase [Actinomycetota bacterium]